MQRSLASTLAAIDTHQLYLMLQGFVGVGYLLVWGWGGCQTAHLVVNLNL